MSLLIDGLQVLTSGGVLLADVNFGRSKAATIEKYIKEVILEGRQNYQTHSQERVVYQHDAGLGLFAVGAYDGIKPVAQVEALLEAVLDLTRDRVAEAEVGAVPFFAPHEVCRCLPDEGAELISAAEIKALMVRPSEAKPTKRLEHGAKKEAFWADSSKSKVSALGSLDFSVPSPAGSPTATTFAGEFDEEVGVSAPGFISRTFTQTKDILAGYLLGHKVLTDADVAGLLDKKFRSKLLEKNVAEEVVCTICEQLRNVLVGRTTSGFQSTSAAVREGLVSVLSRLLLPRRAIDVLKEASAAKYRGKVYSILFLGVNGVGKSTNLAKVAYYLKRKGGLRVMIAACDTFRAGAVEQLRTHAQRLDVELFEQGYGKDASAIAASALSLASQKSYDVVLIDTAGRMQDNIPLMRSLAKLVDHNDPDLVLFVGEALTGNDALDQFKKFNSALSDFSTRGGRSIDGIVLSKFDTVDSKVGAAVTLVCDTGAPLTFLGTGQNYTNLQKPNAAQIVDMLLS
ncbi:MAG: hypothetical protein KVP17_000449 [Porospora cf. gigantea B]|uniref:uncharacterized protein n=1 Tax=Porospora cf. gigantea B TaxID=2853592 RepID=UPI003571C581|nr:MAG: hypothetical protein KVP17_000449 [Porospora cf. gigantea B]